MKFLALSAIVAAGLLQSVAHSPITSTSSSDFSDLAFLGPLVANKRIVQLGESGHGMGEQQRLKSRIVQYLHERAGFDVIAFESSLFHCYAAESRAASVESRATLTNCALGVWHNTEVLPVFDVIKTSRSSARPLRLAGFDVQPIGPLRKQRAAFFQRVLAAADPAAGAKIAALDAAVIAEYDKGSSARRDYFRANKNALAAEYEAAAQFIDQNLASLQKALGREDPIVARQELRSMAAYIAQQASQDMTIYAEARDKGMADNVAFIANELFPGRKVIVWADDYHVRYANERIGVNPDIFPGAVARSMGGWIRSAFGSAVYTIGSYANQGQAADNARKVYDIAAPEANSLEALLAQSNSEISFIDLAAQGSAWASSPQRMRYNGQGVHTMTPREQYDAIIFFKRVSPPHFL